ncbi:MAG: hypothetical protein UT82_C0028G0002 [Parcubacteria group bacterium GW2011_GWB1_40_14]|nr:MAG: hypothetical protein UT82_C0028G0002 [Parcubacteria group bacterium GW2011_GWB1_40_14]
MATNEIEIKDEDLKDVEDFTPEELETEDFDWKAKALERTGIAKRRTTQLKKAKDALTARDITIKDLEGKIPPEPKLQDKNKPDEFGLLQKTYLRSAGITAEDEVELARDIQKKTGLDWDKLVDDDYFKSKLEVLRTAKANEEATLGVKGGGGTTQAKNTPEYWIAKGVPPTAEQVPDRKLRAKIARAMMAQSKDGSKFYNE